MHVTDAPETIDRITKEIDEGDSYSVSAGYPKPSKSKTTGTQNICLPLLTF